MTWRSRAGWSPRPTPASSAWSTLDDVSLSCVYKPIAGERPLWDFPGGSLAGREVSARLVSEAGGFGIVPPTVMRDGPYGRGMCQRWVHVDPERDLVDVVPPDFDEPGWIAVLEAEDHRERPVLLVHADDDRLRDMALLDVVINNADRKGGHVLAEPEPASRVCGCDHGVCFHEEPKLRTVLWGWADEPLRDRDTEMLRVLDERCRGDLGDELEQHLSRVEVNAVRYRIDRLLERRPDAEPGGPVAGHPVARVLTHRSTTSRVPSCEPGRHRSIPTRRSVSSARRPSSGSTTPARARCVRRAPVTWPACTSAASRRTTRRTWATRRRTRPSTW